MDLLAEHGLKRRRNDLKLIMMCEIPSNAILAEQFLQYFDGYSIGSNDLTQLTLGLDRDLGLVAHSFDERDPAVSSCCRCPSRRANKLGKYVGICGQGPSDHSRPGRVADGRGHPDHLAEPGHGGSIPGLQARRARQALNAARRLSHRGRADRRVGALFMHPGVAVMPPGRLPAKMRACLACGFEDRMSGLGDELRGGAHRARAGGCKAAPRRIRRARRPGGTRCTAGADAVGAVCPLQRGMLVGSLLRHLLGDARPPPRA